MQTKFSGANSTVPMSARAVVASDKSTLWREKVTRKVTVKRTKVASTYANKNV